MPENRSIITLKLPAHLEIFTLPLKELPPKWWVNPAPPQLAQLGQKWLEQQSGVALVVPSSVTPVGEGRNYILNPQHPDFKNIELVKIANTNLQK
jgi:RES domain-containing protein